jgi:hypothetical protein
VSVVRTAAEELFGVRLDHVGQRTTASMATGPWLRAATGAVPAGVLGVLVDDAFGYAVNAGAGPAGWSVTTELALEQPVGTPVTGRSRSVRSDSAYMRADEVALQVSQYVDTTSRSASSSNSDEPSGPVSDHASSFSPIQARRPTGESSRAYPSVCGRVIWMSA